MHAIVVYVLGVAGLLLLVSALPPLAARLRVPYTVLLAAAGIALGALIKGATVLDGLAGPLGDFFVSLSGLDLSSETLLYIFLPILLFETALAIDVRRLIDDLAPILAMAVVAVFVCTFAVGYALWAVSPMGLVPCLLLGAIVATTDPAAVVSIFRDLGAPRRLTMLVEGESLLNDAAAIALFTLLLGMLTRRSDGGVLEAAIDFLRSFGGGACVGFVLGRLACLLVTPVRDQPMAEITLTVALAYLSYLLADHYLDVSGVVAVVAAALVVGSVGKTRISPDTWVALEHIWKQLGFWANSLIFLLVALVIPHIVERVAWSDAGYLVVAVAAALAARGVVLFGLLPALSAFGLAQRVGHATKAVMLWGGLRGAVSLALAMAVTENGRVPAGVQEFVAVLATGFVFFTLFVNGTTLRPVMHKLGLDRLSPVERAMRNRALALSVARVQERVGDLARTYEIEELATQRMLDHYAERLEAIEGERHAEAPLSQAERVTIGLVILVNREQERYYAHFQEGILSRGVVEFLAARAARTLDAVRAQGEAGYAKAADGIIDFSLQMRAASWLHRHFGIQRPLARRLAMRFEVLVSVRMVLRELRAFSRQRLAQVLGPDSAVELEGLLAVRLDRVEKALAALRLQYPDYATVLQNQYLGRAALRLEAADYRALHAESVISQEVLNDLERDIAGRRRALEQAPTLDLRLDRNELVRRVPIFAGLAPERAARIVKLLKSRLVLPGETIVRRGDRGDCMFFVASGAVEVLVPGLEMPVKLGSGDFFGEMALLNGQPRNADVRALGYCQLLVLEEKDFWRLVRKDPSLRTHIEDVAAKRRAPARLPQPVAVPAGE
ncbi:cation:proton antiporter [Azospirillum sp. TSO22-1]|uniref:cation:proton antiporter n=1 Tax=Azospirillum sp. TSO22-1 TaxID=716789 RepID=UPI000D60F056|nr:cation:proton antiporter [Azospirillum sp. TSO22-1]PWC31773.1 sodium:proton antiporter [Azospirillum sp. TSO22-1]